MSRTGFFRKRGGEVIKYFCIILYTFSNRFVQNCLGVVKNWKYRAYKLDNDNLNVSYFEPETNIEKGKIPMYQARLEKGDSRNTWASGK